MKHRAFAALLSAVCLLPVRTLAGATAATLLIVQFAKLPLDRGWKIPTRLLVLVVAFLILLCAQIFTAGLSPESLPLIVLNSFLAAAAAMGAYEVALSR